MIDLSASPHSLGIIDLRIGLHLLGMSNAHADEPSG